ncbi:uncharacterized protein LOC142905681 [Petromyzon marinus]|uniref:uncharacterized protein LOC142905681 n=1 Tax=Petromyzon marinus TaxID=7757 RepID=UPI003F6EB1C6
MAARFGQAEVCRFLLQQGAQVNGGDNLNRTPLMRACEHGRRSAVEVLLGAGADTSVADFLGNSAAHYAVLCAENRPGLLALLRAKNQPTAVAGGTGGTTDSTGKAAARGANIITSGTSAAGTASGATSGTTATAAGGLTATAATTATSGATDGAAASDASGSAVAAIASATTAAMASSRGATQPPGKGPAHGTHQQKAAQHHGKEGVGHGGGDGVKKRKAPPPPQRRPSGKGQKPSKAAEPTAPSSASTSTTTAVTAVATAAAAAAAAPSSKGKEAREVTGKSSNPAPASDPSHGQQGSSAVKPPGAKVPGPVEKPIRAAKVTSSSSSTIITETATMTTSNSGTAVRTPSPPAGVPSEALAKNGNANDGNSASPAAQPTTQHLQSPEKPERKVSKGPEIVEEEAEEEEATAVSPSPSSKPDQQKPPTSKSDQQKPPSSKPDEQKASTSQSDNRKPGDPQSDQKKAAASKSDRQKPPASQFEHQEPPTASHADQQKLAASPTAAVEKTSPSSPPSSSSSVRQPNKQPSREAATSSGERPPASSLSPGHKSASEESLDQISDSTTCSEETGGSRRDGSTRVEPRKTPSGITRRKEGSRDVLATILRLQETLAAHAKEAPQQASSATSCTAVAEVHGCKSGGLT